MKETVMGRIDSLYDMLGKDSDIDKIQSALNSVTELQKFNWDKVIIQFLSSKTEAIIFIRKKELAHSPDLGFIDVCNLSAKR